MGCEVVELNVQEDHVHLIAMILPNVALPALMGRMKGQTTINLFQRFLELRRKPYWGSHFWSRGYCVDTVGVNAVMIQRYVKYQEKQEQYEEHTTLGHPLWGLGRCPLWGGANHSPALWTGLFTIKDEPTGLQPMVVNSVGPANCTGEACS